MGSEEKIRVLHAYNEQAALALATELRRFAKGCKTGTWYATRTVRKGKATNDRDGKTKPVIV